MTELKTVVISGGMGGVGQAVAQHFSAQGYRTAVLYRSSSKEAVESFKATLKGKHLFLPCDVTDAEQTAKSLEEIRTIFGHIDVGIHAAVDPIARKKILDLDIASFRSQFEAGFFGAFNFFTPLAHILKEQQKGTLIGITSIAVESDTTMLRLGAYTVAKIALQGLLRELSRELNTKDVHVFAVAPGLMQTSLNADLPVRVFEIAANQDASSITTPDAVAQACLYLCEEGELRNGTYHTTTGEISLL